MWLKLKYFGDMGWLVVCDKRGCGEHHGRVILACHKERGILGWFCVDVILLLLFLLLFLLFFPRLT